MRSLFARFLDAPLWFVEYWIALSGIGISCLLPKPFDSLMWAASTGALLSLLPFVIMDAVRDMQEAKNGEPHV
jgi:hypothetical protein